MAENAAAHIPVMADRILELLSPAVRAPGAVLVDGTLGMGGHTAALLAACPELRVVGIDRDVMALEFSRARLSADLDRVDFVHARYDDIAEVLRELGIPTVQGILLDLGVSSPQLDDGSRGFAYSYDAPLDMRMDQSQPFTAADVVNSYSGGELARILRQYGEERFARRIADAILRERANDAIDSTARLATIVRDAIPAPARRTGGNPAKRSFQAIRIEVNAEISVLEETLPSAIDRLAVGGRIAVLSYHSLEDRATKRALSARARDTTPQDLPVSLPERQPELRLLTRGAEVPTAEESGENSRAASARLRAAERVRVPSGGKSGHSGQAGG